MRKLRMCKIEVLRKGKKTDFNFKRIKILKKFNLTKNEFRLKNYTI